MKRFQSLLDNLEEYLAALFFSAMVILIFLQILSRFVFNFSLGWTEELARYSFVVMVYFSAVVAAKRNRHLKVAFMHEALPRKIAFFFWILSYVVWSGFNIAMIYIGIPMAQLILNTGQTSPVMSIPMGMLYMIIPIGYFLLQIRILQRVAVEWRERWYGPPDNGALEDKT